MPALRSIAVLLPLVFSGLVLLVAFGGDNAPLPFPLTLDGVSSSLEPGLEPGLEPVVKEQAGCSDSVELEAGAPAPTAAPPGREVPAPGPAVASAQGNWWSGKEDLLRSVERSKYFPAPGSVTGESGTDLPKDAAEVAKARADFVFKEFRSWARLYHYEKDSAKRRLLLTEGMVRATIRRPHMIDLMVSDPKAALKASLPLPVYASLPGELSVLVEKPFSELVTIRPVAEGGAPRHEIVFPGETEPLAGSLFGRRADCAFKTRCPAQGIRLGGVAVLREAVLQVLRGDDIAAATTLFDPALANPDPMRCFATGNPLGARRARALTAGALFIFESGRTLHEFELKIGALDELPGDRAGSGVLFLPQASREAAAGFDFAVAKRDWGSLSAE